MPPLGARNAAVRRLRALLRDARTRAAERAFVAEGPRVVAAGLDRGVAFEAVFFGPNATVAFGPLAERVEASGIEVVVLKEGVLERIGSTVTPQPVLAVAPRPDHDPDALARGGLVLLGVGLQDPGNVGTIIRGAEASGAAALVLSDGSVDAYNPKAVRASAGAIFDLPVLGPGSVGASARRGAGTVGDPGSVLDSSVKGWSAVQALDALGEVGRRCLGADAAADTPYFEVDFRRPTAIVLGNEAHGLDAAVRERLDGEVAIPMRSRAESLNVAMAATVLCFESARQRGGG
jgi:TrmH family RNA methyltransferase